MEKDSYFTVRDLADLLKISRGGIYVAMSRQTFPIPYIKVGRRVRSSSEDVSRYLNGLPKVGGDRPVRKGEVT